MNNLYKQIGICTSVILMCSACEQYEKLDFHVDKPESILAQEELNAYAALKSYINRSANPDFHLGAAVTLDNYTGKGVMYRLVNHDFDEVAINDFNHGSVVQANGSLSLGKIPVLIEAAKASNVAVFGSSLVSNANQNATYLNGLMAPLIIQGDAARALVVTFDNDNLGTTYPMSVTAPANSSTVVVHNITKSGRVLNVKGVRSHPIFNVTLPQGRVLGDYVSVTLDMFITDGTGRFGAGMRMSINGGTVVAYPSPSNLGINNGVWGKMVLPLATMELTAAQKQLSSFTLMIGSETGAADYFIDNIAMQDINIPKTENQKKQLIESAFQTWISGVVDTAKSYVKAWNVISNPMDDARPAEIKTGVGKTPAAGEFFWQDYLGGKDYAVKAFQLTRQRGNSGDKLFISDNNLATNLAKCNGLIGYVNYIESKGAKVDGIGTELDLTINSDKDQIAEMFRLLAVTGKLIRISGLQVSIGVTKDKANSLLYKQQSDMYNYVVNKYFELVPLKQRYGITIKSLLDLPGTTGEPIGIWNEAYVRKPAFAGIAEALKNNNK